MFYIFRQNNSGGHFDFIEDIGITVKLFIEANSPEHANEIMSNLIDDDWCGGHGGYCECCGERWYRLWEDEKGIENPVEYVMEELESCWRLNWIKEGYNYCIHYLSGEKVWY